MESADIVAMLEEFSHTFDFTFKGLSKRFGYSKYFAIMDQIEFR